jgi:hypothetical protein
MNVSQVNIVEFKPINDFLNGRREQAHSAYPPIGLLALAAVLERQRHEIEVVDCANLILQGELILDDDVWKGAAPGETKRRFI